MRALNNHTVGTVCPVATFASRRRVSCSFPALILAGGAESVLPAFYRQGEPRLGHN